MNRFKAKLLIRRFKKGYSPDLDTTSEKSKKRSVEEIVLYGLYKQYPDKSKVLPFIYSRIKIEVL